MKNQSGNVLIFILIAIGLMGLLTATLTRSSNTTNDTGEYERNEIVASEILRYAKSVENAVQSLIARGCSENELSFWHDSNGDGVEGAADDYYNANSPTDHSCHVFEPEGAGLTHITPNENWLDTSLSAEPFYNEIVFADTSCINDVGGTDTTANCATDGSAHNTDIIMFVTYIKQSICQSINRTQNIADIPVDSGAMFANSSNVFFNGAFLNLNNIGVVNSGTSLNGKATACAEADTVPDKGYHFYHVLHAR
jgi:type II secretory pathway pseudopilin PulG